MLGPEANQFMLVSHPENFVWREGSFGDLIPLLGDGLLTIDGAYHDRARRIMMPAFHSEQIEASQTAMAREAAAAMDGLGRRRRRRHLRTGCETSRCGSRCAPCWASIPTMRVTGQRPPTTSSSPWPSTGRTPRSACGATGGARGGG